MSKELDDAHEEFFAEMYDISDVKFHIKQTRSRRKVELVAESESDFNLFKYYLALKTYIERIEHEIGVMDGPPEVM